MQRTSRNAYLDQSDWTQLPDVALTAAKVAEWATYRQQLRDFPATWPPAETLDLPDPPA